MFAYLQSHYNKYNDFIELELIIDQGEMNFLSRNIIIKTNMIITGIKFLCSFC